MEKQKLFVIFVADTWGKGSAKSTDNVASWSVNKLNFYHYGLFVE